jgi:hypothetical protein
MSRREEVVLEEGVAGARCGREERTRRRRVRELEIDGG